MKIGGLVSFVSSWTEGEAIDESALKDLIRAAVAHNVR